jgi:putative membrane protein
MKMMNKFLCCAMLAGAATLVPAYAHAATPSDGDKEFLAKAAQSDVNEYKLSQLAVEKTANPEVKAFAEKMVSEHMKMTLSMKPFVTAWGLTAPVDLDEDHKKDYAKLSGMTGADFDKEYMDLMVSDHSKGLDLFTDEAKDTKDMKFRAVVLKGKTMVAAHKNMAYDLKKKL